MTKIDRLYLQKREHEFLAPYAAKSDFTRGRVYTELSHPYRTEYQRDRERIIHSKAFRRLEYKTQVFVNHEGDHYRTRLTHTIEVSQIARTIARTLRLNEDLSETLALAHDLGHTPFGHSGEREFNEILKDEGGFEHNRQSLRVVEKLEDRYSSFPGLNLTWETREGIIKHSSTNHAEVADYAPDEFPSLEAQIIDFADEIAYNNHDLDDGIRSGLLDFSEVKNLSIWHMGIDAIGGADRLPADKDQQVNMIIRSIINLLVSDLIDTVAGNIKAMNIKDYADIRCAEKLIAGFSKDIHEANYELKKVLNKKLYKHYKVIRMGIKAQKVIRELFNLYIEFPNALPDEYFNRIETEGLKQAISDYIAGMTDRFALEEHQKLTEPMIKV
ncbi:MAG: deoxyguanosinetriphosphate triphosphohydrolase [Spirochaetes bacterium]|nr:deoxyguanosinetriphosphate triphosphohydrolase [Spirochaetota bacterium]